MKSVFAACFVLALMAASGSAQLDSCEGCLSTMTVLTTWASSPEVVEDQIELLLIQVCQEDVDCEDAYKLYWGPVSDTLFGDYHDETVHELCKLGLHCQRRSSFRAILKEYTDCATCEEDMTFIGDLFQHPNVIAHLDTEIKRLYCSTFHGHAHADCEHFVNNWAEPAFHALGAHLSVAGADICEDLFQCPAEPTEEPTEEPTTTMTDY